LNWKNLSVKRKEKASAYVSKAITGNCPKSIAEKFKISNSERYDLRSNNSIAKTENKLYGSHLWVCCC
jgi:hypothetical protein